MPHYIYTAVDINGRSLKSAGEFESVIDLLNSLEVDGLSLVGYRRSLSAGKGSLLRGVSRLELVEFFRNLSLMLKGGVPLRDALEDLHRTGEQNQLNIVFGRVRKKLEEGILFSESLAEENKYVPGIILPLVAIGEETGRLDRTLEDAANHLEKVQEIISATRRALVYPAFIILAMTGAMVFWMVYVLPQMLELFKTMGLKELPLATRILIGATDLFHTWWPLLPLAAVTVLMFYMISRVNNTMRYIWDLCMNHIPVLGRVLRASQLAFFFEYSALLAAGGIHIVRGLELMGESVSNTILKGGINSIREDIISGKSMSDAAADLPFFEPFILRMIRVGEQTGSMPGQFSILAEYYMNKVNKLVETMAKTLEPAIIIVAGFVFMVIALGLLGPIYNLVSAIK